MRSAAAVRGSDNKPQLAATAPTEVARKKVVMNMPKGSRCDLVGFGNAGVWVALSSGDGTFQNAVLTLDDMGTDQGWQGGGVNPRMVADVTGDGRGDLVGFYTDGVYLALSNGDGTFGPMNKVLDNMGK